MINNLFHFFITVATVSRDICLDKATALCDILYKRLRNILTYLLTYDHM